MSVAPLPQSSGLVPHPASGIEPLRRAGSPSGLAAPSPTVRRRAFRALIALSMARLRKAPMVRIGRILALTVGAVMAAMVLGLRLSDGDTAPVEGFVVFAARAVAFIAAGAVALAAANQRAVIDRRDGLEILAFSRGASPRSIAVARILGTSFLAARLCFVPQALVAVAAIASAGDARRAVARTLLLVVCAVFAMLSGFSLGMLATFCDRVRPSGGRGLFVALVLVPWAVFGMVGHEVLSLPGALGAVLSLGLDFIGLGRFS